MKEILRLIEKHIRGLDYCLVRGDVVRTLELLGYEKVAFESWEDGENLINRLGLYNKGLNKYVIYEEIEGDFNSVGIEFFDEFVGDLRYFYDKIRGIKYDLNLEYDFYKDYD